MKQTIPERVVDACDYCGRSDTYLQKCIRCSCDFCMTCRATIAGCIVGPPVCRECGGRDDVQRVCNKYADQLSLIVEERNTAIKRLKAADAERTPNDDIAEGKTKTFSSAEEMIDSLNKTWDAEQDSEGGGSD